MNKMTPPISPTHHTPPIGRGQELALCRLPQDIIIEILKRLNAQDLSACRQISREWNQMMKGNEALWTNLFSRHFPNQYSRNAQNIRSFEAAYQNQQTLFQNLKNGM